MWIIPIHKITQKWTTTENSHYTVYQYQQTSNTNQIGSADSAETNHLWVIGHLLHIVKQRDKSAPGTEKFVWL